jgi:hypothetical protein
MTRIATLNVLFHVAGLLFAALGMRSGTPAADIPDRMQYLALQPLGWTVGWIVWMGCAIVMVAFAVAVARRLRETSRLANWAVVVLLVAASFDLLADSIYITVLPEVAALQPPQPALFRSVEHITLIISLAIANTLYSLGTLLLTFALREVEEFRLAVKLTGWAVFAFGLALSGSVFTADWRYTEWATAPTIGLYCIWVVLVNRSLSCSGLGK